MPASDKDLMLYDFKACLNLISALNKKSAGKLVDTNAYPSFTL